MPAFTPNLNLYKPGGGSTGLILPDEVVDIDRINANSDIIDAAVAALQDRDKKFSLNVAGATERDTWYPSPVVGDRVYQRDIGLEMVYGANGWQAAVGLVPLRPTSVSGSGVTISPAGQVVCTSTPTGYWNINGVFDPNKFRRYRMVYNFDKPSDSPWTEFQYRTASENLTDPGYFTSQINLVGISTTITAHQTTAVTSTANYFDGTGRKVFGVVDFSFAEDNTAFMAVGNVVSRKNNLEMKFVTSGYEGSSNAPNIRGISVNFGQTNSGRFSFFAYSS